MTDADGFILTPTVLYRMDLEHDLLSTATVPTAYGEALIVFRGPEDARGYQRTTGKHTASEGFKAVNLDHEQVADVLAMHGLSWVAMPEPWTGEASSGVDVFSRGDFIRFLAECAPASPA